MKYATSFNAVAAPTQITPTRERKGEMGKIMWCQEKATKRVGANKWEEAKVMCKRILAHFDTFTCSIFIEWTFFRIWFLSCPFSSTSWYLCILAVDIFLLSPFFFWISSKFAGLHCFAEQPTQRTWQQKGSGKYYIIETKNIQCYKIIVLLHSHIKPNKKVPIKLAGRKNAQRTWKTSLVFNGLLFWHFAEMMPAQIMCWQWFNFDDKLSNYTSTLSHSTEHNSIVCGGVLLYYFMRALSLPLSAARGCHFLVFRSILLIYLYCLKIAYVSYKLFHTSELLVNHYKLRLNRSCSHQAKGKTKEIFRQKK